MIAAALAALAVTGAPVDVALEVRPRALLFGDVVEARATVVVDPRRVDPETLAVHIRPGTLTKLTERREVERTAGTAVVRVTARLACRSERCLAFVDPIAIALPPATIAGRRHRWPSIVTLPRITGTALKPDSPPWRVDLTPPPPSYRADPEALSRAFAAAGALLGLVGLALLAREAVALYARRPRASATPLERALARMRAAARGDTRERRRAVGAVARALAAENGSLSAVAAELAWAPAAPSPDAVEALVARVEREVRR